MSKILVLTNHSYMLYRFRLELLQELAKKHEVVLSMPFVGHEEDFKALGFRCIETQIDRRGVNPVTDGKLMRFYQNLLRQEQPNLVITYSIKPNIYGGFACRMAGVPYCANVQGLGTAFQKAGLAALVTVMYKTALKKAKTVFFENTANAQAFLDRGIVSQNCVTVLPGAGVDLRQFEPAVYPEHRTVRFLYVGRIMREKGMDELFHAARRLKAQGVPFVLDLVGFYEDAYKSEVEQLRAEGIVQFHGFQQDPRPFYAAADCVVLPSYHEGMSNVLLEAAAMGRPVITSDIPGCREAVEDGVSGLLCKVKDGNSLYEKMLAMTQLSAQQRAVMGQAGRAKMEREFDKRQVVSATLEAMNM